MRKFSKAEGKLTSKVMEKASSFIGYVMRNWKLEKALKSDTKKEDICEELEYTVMV